MSVLAELKSEPNYISSLSKKNALLFHGTMRIWKVWFGNDKLSLYTYNLGVKVNAKKIKIHLILHNFNPSQANALAPVYTLLPHGGTTFGHK